MALLDKDVLDHITATLLRELPETEDNLAAMEQQVFEAIQQIGGTTLQAKLDAKKRGTQAADPVVSAAIGGGSRSIARSSC